MKTKKHIVACLALTILLASCGQQKKEETPEAKESVEQEISGSGEVKIGNQIWSTINLTVKKFKNGEEIPEAKTSEEWFKATEENKPVWSYYGYDSKNAKYGKLYNWYAVNDPRGLAPEGWHVPSMEEFEELAKALGGDKIAGKKMKSKMGWYSEGNGTNESGFNSLPGGYNKMDGLSCDMGDVATYWSSTINKGTSFSYFGVLYSTLLDENFQISGIDNTFGITMADQGEGRSVRCVKNQ